MTAFALRESGPAPAAPREPSAPIVRAGTLTIPGQPWRLNWRRDADGRLVELRCETRTHLVERDGARYFGDELATVSELHDGARLVRVVHAHSEILVEEYRVDALGRLAHVDGVDVVRDPAGRVTRAGAWSYGYDGDVLVTVDGPFGHRAIEHDATRRAIGVRDSVGYRAFSYDVAGRRIDVAGLPADTYHRDEHGRLWTITDDRGAVVATFLWEGMWCLGRIDGDARAPLAAVFSLDPTATPVRIIDAGGVRRVPRDAFGEGLLAEPLVPGLFGAAVHDGLHYLPARAVDPRTGHFCAPDPWNGGPADPRRVEHRDAALLVEQPGRYVVCRNDPIGRTDPTGCISLSTALVAFSSLTWASSTTVFGLLGFDLSINFWLSLFTGNIRDWGASFGDTMSARRHGGFGVRRGGLLGFERAYTIGHYVMHDALVYAGYDLIAAFVPSTPMPLSGYGTLLQLAPQKDGGPFLLDGSRGITGGTAARGWTRGGGVGDPVYPGATVAKYDSGALHIDRTQTTDGSKTVLVKGFDVASVNVLGPQGCRLTELAPTGGWAAGISVSNLSAVTLAGTSLGIGIGNLELLTHATTDATGATVIDAAVIATVLNVVEKDGKTEVTLETSGVGLPTPFRLRALGPAPPPESANALAGQSGYLSTAGTAAPYAAGDPLRLSQTSGAAGLVPVGAAVIVRLEAQLTLDEGPPANATAVSLTLVTAGAAGGAAVVVTGEAKMTCSGAVPPIPSVIAIIVGTDTLPVAAIAIADNPAGGKDVTLDRKNTFSGSGNWSPLVPSGASFGSAQKVDAGVGVTVTYLPAAPRTTPAVGGFLRLDVSNANPTARAVTAVNYDALVLTSLPGNVASAYSVERFPFLSVDQSNLGLVQKPGLDIDPALTPPANQTLNGVALRLHELNGPTLAAAAAGVASTLPGLTLTVASASLTTPLTAPAVGANPNPGQLMLLSDGAAILELTVVTGIQLTVNCDRPWIGSTIAKLEAFPIVDGGVAYPAISVGAAGTLVMTLANTLTLGGNPVIVEMPRFAVGEIVRLSWKDGAAAFNEIFRVSDVEALKSGGGTGVPLVDSPTITLVGGGLTPSATASAFTVTRQVPAGPAANTGSAREGIHGTVGAVPAGGTNPQMTFNVWRVDALAAADYAISDGATALPMRFVAPTAVLQGTLVIQLGAAPTAFANGTQPTLRIPTLASPATPAGVKPTFSATVYAASFTQTGNVVNFTVHPDEPSVLAPATGNIIVAVPFGQNQSASSVTPPTAAPTDGTITPGTVLIPEDTSFELTLKEGLIEHETRHTMQYSWFGPLMWGIYPLVPLLDKVYPGVDDSKFSASFDGELIQGAGESTIRLTNFGTTKLKSGDAISGGLNVPVVLGRANTTLTEPAGSLSFFIADEDFNKLRAVGDNSGKLQVRKITKPSKAAAFFLKSAPAFLTPGGVTEAAIANTWGWFVYGIVRVIYALKARSNFGGLTYTAKVSADGTSLTMNDVAGTDAMIDVSRIMVQHKDSTVIRTVTVGATDDVLVLSEPLTSLKDTEVEVAPYDTHQPASNWDWNRYYPAKLAGANKPVTIVVEPANAEGTNKLVLKLRDEVLLRTGNVSKKSVVTAVNADGSYDLEDPPQLALGGQSGALDQEFRIAKIGEHDPVGSLGALTANFIHAPWLGKVSDPWAWLLSMPNTTPRSAGDWTLRVLRWLASSHSFSMYFPGWLWIDDLFRGTNAFNSWMEQDASENSGDLYSSLGRFESAPSKVGDIGRYWFFPNGRYLSRYPDKGFDAAGARILREVVVAPLVTAETPGGAPSINKNAGSEAPVNVPPAVGAPLPPGAGDAVPDALYTKNAADPRLPAGLPPSFAPNDRGIIPLGGAVERTNGAYVAFTRPGKHRATIKEDYHQLKGDTKDSRSVVDSGAGLLGFKSVTLFFDRTVADLDVKIAGIPLANDDNVTLVLTQTAAVSVTPVDPNRRYALTLQRPMNGPLLRADQTNNDPNKIQVQAPAALPATPVEPVELCRVYRFDPATQAFDDPVLNRFKMSLPGDLRIPVRRFTVTVTATITARSKVSISAADDIAAMVPGGDAFVLVPASVAAPLSIVISYSPAAPPGTKDPVLTFDPVDIPNDLQEDGVIGTAFQIKCDPGDPPEQTATLSLSVNVGVGGLAATLTGTLLLNPAFVLDAPGANFQVARGATIVLTAHDLASPPGDVNVSAVDPLAGVTVTVSNATITLVVDATAAAGPQRVVATPASDPNGPTRAARTITIV